MKYIKTVKLKVKCYVCETEFIQMAVYNVCCSKKCAAVRQKDNCEKRRMELRALKNPIDMEGEIWKDVKGYEGLYQISNMGRVKSFKHANPKLLTSVNKQGYHSVTLVRSNGVKEPLRVHRIIMTAFIPNPENKPFINHINTIRNDNRLENLEWCTHTENMKHAVYMGRLANQKLVFDTDTGIYYNCVRDAANSKGINYVTLLCRLNGNLKNSTSFIEA